MGEQPPAPLVLVVDDYPDARLLLSYVLADAGFRLVYAENGPEAIAMAREHRPDVIVMDLHLPGMSGLEAAQALRADASLSAIPVIANTLSSAPVTEEHAIFDAVCTKPTSPDCLVETVHRVLRARREGLR